MGRRANYTTKADVTVQVKKLGMYMKNLKAAARNVPKKGLGVLAATALERAVRATVRDSGRAAANWNLRFGPEPPPPTWDPREYGGSINGLGSIGTRGDKVPLELVLDVKRNYYGFTSHGSYSMPAPGGMIYREMKIGTNLGQAKQANLYNPIFSGSNPADAIYAQHAFEATIAGTDSFSIYAGAAGAIPRIIQELVEEVKTGYGK